MGILNLVDSLTTVDASGIICLDLYFCLQVADAPREKQYHLDDVL